MTGKVKITPPKPEESWPDDHLEVHPAMQLLLARMESYPEEFYERTRTRTAPLRSASTTQSNPKWREHNMHIEQVRTHWNRKEKRLYNEALRKIRLEEYHITLMKIILI